MPKQASRRLFLRRAFATIGLAWPALALAKTAPAKLSKATVHYQTHPKGHEMCGMCGFFVPAEGHANGLMMGGMKANGTMALGHCQKVAGRITPMGYCVLFTPRTHIKP